MSCHRWHPADDVPDRETELQFEVPAFVAGSQLRRVGCHDGAGVPWSPAGDRLRVVFGVPAPLPSVPVSIVKIISMFFALQCFHLQLRHSFAMNRVSGGEGWSGFSDLGYGECSH
jgi:hypothetical protein